MLACPHCHTEINLAHLPHPSLFASHRICPSCGRSLTIDRETKTRQLIALPFGLLSLTLTLLLYFDGTQWLVPAVASYVILAALIYWGNKHVRLVPFGNRPGDA